jgi:hypothetical protein
MGQDGNVYVAAVVLIAAGTVLLIIVNLVFTHRVIRAQHPRHGWNPILTLMFLGMYFLILCALTLCLVALIQSFFVRDQYIRNIDRNFQIFGTTFFAFAAVLPLPLIILSSLTPRGTRQIDKFGSGHFHTKVWVLVIGVILVSLSLFFKAGTTWMSPVSRQYQIPDYYSRAWYYATGFTIEVIVVYLYALARVDKRFYVRDGARGPGAYSGMYHGPPKEIIDTPRDSHIPALRHPDDGYYQGGGYPSGNPNGVQPLAGNPSGGNHHNGHHYGAMAAGAGAAAGIGAAALHHHHNKHRDLDDEKDIEHEYGRPASPMPNLDGLSSGVVSPEPMASGAIRRDTVSEFDDGPLPSLTPAPAYNGDDDDVFHDHGEKEVRGFDTETIPEVSEEDSEDSLYAMDSTIGPDSKRNSMMVRDEHGHDYDKDAKR